MLQAGTAPDSRCLEDARAPLERTPRWYICGMRTDDSYELLRQFASPLVAITTAWRGRTNGMISDSAVRASISPAVPRISVFVHKWHFSHDLIWDSGRFGLHMLHEGQLGLVYELGFVSGRDRNKLAGIPHRIGASGVPLLEDCYAAFECRVINTMDNGFATMFLGDVLATHPGRGDAAMTPPYLRANMPAAWREEFLRNYRVAQEHIDQHREIQDLHWKAAGR